MDNEASKNNGAIKKFNEEMVEVRKTINKGYFLYVYFADTKIKLVEDVKEEKRVSDSRCGLIVGAVVIVYFAILFRYPFETVLYTIIGVIVLGVLGAVVFSLR